MRMRSRTQAVYVISVAAELAGMHPQTLRIYERGACSSRPGRPAATAATRTRTSSGCAASRARRRGHEPRRHPPGMELEEEVAHLRAELEEAAETASGAMAEAERRQRRDLVPLSQAVAIYGQWSRAEQDERRRWRPTTGPEHAGRGPAHVPGGSCRATLAVAQPSTDRYRAAGRPA